MEVEAESLIRNTPDQAVKSETNRRERNRLIAHLGRVFARSYDIQVLPSRQRGFWACSIDPKVLQEMNLYLRGERATLDDIPEASFKPKQIFYDERGAQEMSMDEITALLHHEAGHAKYTDFRSWVEGQKQAKDEGHLPTSFWLVMEGLEDPRVNTLEGEESSSIDRLIRTNQGNELQKRITEAPLKDKPLLLQFAYNSFHYWLRDEGIPELQGTEVGRLTESVRPLLTQYFQNSDLEERKLLQKKIWDIAKVLEKKDLEQEEMRQMAQKQKDQQGQGQAGGGEGTQSGTGSQNENSEPQPGSEGQGDGGEPASPSIPGGRGGGIKQSPDMSPGGSQGESKESQGKGKYRFLEKLKNILGRKNSSPDNQEPQKGTSQSGEESFQGQEEDKSSFGHEMSPSVQSRKPEKFDLSNLTPEELQALKEAIDNLSPEEKAELTKNARENLDGAQKEALKDKILKMFKLSKNPETGDYEATLQAVDEKGKTESEKDYGEALKEVEAEEKAEWERIDAERRKQEELFKQQEAKRREKQEMAKAGFEEEEREKYLIYEALEDSMYAHVRNFKQAIEKVIPRKKEPVYEDGYFSGSKFDRRSLIRKAPIGDERFHMRQVEKPIGEPRLFIGLLVDNSGTMMGKKIEEARKTIVFFARVCREMGIPLMTATFGDDAEMIKSFKQDFNNPSERIKPKIIDATDASGGSTNMHAGIKLTIEAMNEERRKLRDSHGLIFVISDGQANAGLIGDSLRTYIEENRGRLTFKGFGLSGSDSERSSIKTYLNNYFGEGNCAYPEGFDDLPDEAFRVLRVNLMQFQQYLR